MTTPFRTRDDSDSTKRYLLLGIFLVLMPLFGQFTGTFEDVVGLLGEVGIGELVCSLREFVSTYRGAVDMFLRVARMLVVGCRIFEDLWILGLVGEVDEFGCESLLVHLAPLRNVLVEPRLVVASTSDCGKCEMVCEVDIVGLWVRADRTTVSHISGFGWTRKGVSSPTDNRRRPVDNTTERQQDIKTMGHDIQRNMGGREQSQADFDADGVACEPSILEIDTCQQIQTLTPTGELVFDHVDTHIVGTTLDALESEGVIGDGTVDSFEAALEAMGGEETTEDRFELPVPRAAPNQPIPYAVRLTDGDCIDWSVREIGASQDSSNILAQLRDASADIQAAETAPEIMETVERWVSDLLRPTGLEIRLREPATDEFWRVSGTDATTPVDPRQAIDGTTAPYAEVLSEQETRVLDDGRESALTTAVENDLDTTCTPASFETVDGDHKLVFTTVAITPIGDRGIITVGRIGTAISETDRNALELLAEYASTAIEERKNRSTVTEQQTELERYETLVESIPDPVYSTDEKGRITVANRAFEREFDYDPKKHHDAHISEFTTTESAASIREEIRKLVADTENSYTEVPITGLPSGGREREYTASVGVVDYEGEFDGAVGVLRDMTDRHRQEEISKVLNRALRHNLRTTTNNIKGYAEVTQEQVEGDIEGYMDIIQGECDWLMKLADTLRNVRKAVQRGMGGDDVIPISELVEPVLRQYGQSHPHADLQSHYNTDGRIEGGTTLRSALSQLVENAIVHNDSETPSVEIWVANAPDDGWVDIHIEDDGTGIPQNEIELITGETEITQLQHGSGIGLWVSRWLLGTFDGELLIESGGDGSIVTLRLRKLPE